MSEEQEEVSQSEQDRDKKGRFAQKNKTDMNGGSQPRTSDYTKMNSFLAKQLGIEGKLADFQTQYEPEALFKQLSFMADNTESKRGTKPNILPDNQPIAPISPQPNKYELPGTQLKKPNLSKDNFSVSFKINPKDLLQPKKNKT